MSTYRNEIIALLILISGLILSGFMAYLYDVLKPVYPALAFWDGVSAIVVYLLNIIYFAVAITFRPFK